MIVELLPVLFQLTNLTVTSIKAHHAFTAVAVDTVGTVSIIFTGIGNAFIGICKIMRTKHPFIDF